MWFYHYSHKSLFYNSVIAVLVHRNNLIYLNVFITYVLQEIWCGKNFAKNYSNIYFFFQE